MPVMVYLLWKELGPSCLVGMGLILVQPPLQYAMARLNTRLWYVQLTLDNTHTYGFVYVVVQVKVN